MDETLYEASCSKRAKLGWTIGCCLGLPLCAWLSIGDLSAKVTAVAFAVLALACLAETLLQKIVFTTSGLLYTNRFGRRTAIPYSEIDSLRYLMGMELVIRLTSGRKIKISDGDFVRMITIIGDKTGRRPPLKILGVSPRVARWFGGPDRSRPG